VSDLATKATVLSVIAAVEQGDVGKFDQAFKNVDDDSAKQLEKFLIEVVTDRFETFKREDGPKFVENPEFSRAVLRAWQQVSNARGKMGARMAFETAMTTTRRTK
jgi:hypothetical protein